MLLNFNIYRNWLLFSIHLKKFFLFYEKKIAFKYGILYMLLWDNHPSNDNMIDSKKYHVFYDKKGHVSFEIFKYFLYY